MLGGDKALSAQRGDVSLLGGYAIPDARLIGVACVENHDTFIGQNQKSGIVMVVGLKTTAYQNFFPFVFDEVHLGSFDVAMHIDIAYIGGVDVATGTFVVQGARVGKPAPCSLIGHHVRRCGWAGCRFTVLELIGRFGIMACELPVCSAIMASLFGTDTGTDQQ